MQDQFDLLYIPGCRVNCTQLLMTDSSAKRQIQCTCYIPVAKRLRHLHSNKNKHNEKKKNLEQDKSTQD